MAPLSMVLQQPSQLPAQWPLQQLQNLWWLQAPHLQLLQERSPLPAWRPAGSACGSCRRLAEHWQQGCLQQLRQLLPELLRQFLV